MKKTAVLICGLLAAPCWAAEPEPPPVLATVDDLAAEIQRLRELLEAFGIETEAPPPAAEREALETLRAAGYQIRPMSQAERLEIARARQDERLEAERAQEDEELAARIAKAIEDLKAAGYIVKREPPGDPPAIAEAPEISEPPAELRQQPQEPAYSESQLALLSITQARNSRLAAHPALMSSAQRLANYHASSGRWGHSSRSWRGNASENIAHNSAGSVAELGRQWTRSRAHNGNWLSSWQYVGVGVAWSSSGRIYGVQHFSNSPTGAAASSPGLQAGRTVRRRVGLFSRWRRRR